jgi:hypothetical protein
MIPPDWIIEQNKAGYQMVNSVQCLQEIKAFNRMASGANSSSLSIVNGLPCEKVRSAPATIVSGPAQRSLSLWPARSRSRLATLSIGSSTALLPPLPFRLLPCGANQFPGGSCTRRSRAPFHGALFRQLPAKRGGAVVGASVLRKKEGPLVSGGT